MLGFQEKVRIGLDARCDLIDPVGLLHTDHRRVLESWGVDSVNEVKNRTVGRSGEQTDAMDAAHARPEICHR